MTGTQAQSLSLEETSSSFDYLLNKHKGQTIVMFPSLLQEFKKPWTPQSYRNLLFSGGYRSQNQRAALQSPLDMGEEAIKEHNQGHSNGPWVFWAHVETEGFQFTRQPGSYCHTDLCSHYQLLPLQERLHLCYVN